MVEQLLEWLHDEVAGHTPSPATHVPKSVPTDDHSPAQTMLARWRPQFLREQLGEVENFLKEEWSALFQVRPDVQAAWLVSVRYPEEAGTQVALCLRAARAGRESLVEQVSVAFTGLFDPDEKLLILFLSSEQEKQVGAVANAFYVAMAS